VNIRYRFILEGGGEKSFELRFDPKTLLLQRESKEPPPEWTLLGNEKCPNCPLSEDEHPHCPAALSLVDVISEFKDGISFHEADISIMTEQREFRKRAPLQGGISGLIGVVMATSGCPILAMLRPMVATHLPFANVRETMYRAISMYLTAQYFVYKKGRKPDWDMKDLVKIYDAISTVNRQFAKRLRTIKIEDASLNALVSLDCFAAITVDSIMDSSLQEIEGLFHAYLR
jgi:hypothetical protein